MQRCEPGEVAEESGFCCCGCTGNTLDFVAGAITWRGRFGGTKGRNAFPRLGVALSAMFSGDRLLKRDELSNAVHLHTVARL